MILDLLTFLIVFFHVTEDTTLSVDLEDSDSAAVKLEYGVEKRAQDTFGKGSVPDKFCIAPCPQRNFGDSDFTYNPELLYKFEVQNSSQKCTPKSSGYISTLFSHSSEEEEEKRVLNEKFRFHYPHVQITFSKIKSIKKEMLQIAKTCGLDVPTLAYAYVFYEKVVLKGLVNKSNRKLVAGAALLIATKINDHGSMGLSSIIDHIETVFRINRRDMLQLEIPLCVALDFKLHASEAEIVPHCQRIVSAQN
ncbi:unnamed protein product [Anisakis simplex]|uniref:Cyclin N-terminal domain-containing protein n=1 Tax=Anisakis simplex TaxID=6269 RepID=A0A0M3JZB7_ANISI|nr:unnamed protein product [Anisakis simplex]